MKVGIAQANPRVGDLAANSDAIVREARVAAAAGARLVLFPELSLIGYPPLDLLDEPEFVLRALDARALLVERLGAELGDVAVIFGGIGHAHSETGKRLVNLGIVACGGREIAQRPKALLPSYDVFDEDRWFLAGHDTTPIELEGRRIGLSICEDIWNDALYWKHRIYERDPVAELVAAGADLIVNLSASPYHRGKSAQREDMLRATALRHRVPVLFVNQVGGNDELIFDGASLALDADGGVRARLASFESETLVIDLDTSARVGVPESAAVVPPGGAEELRRALVLGIRDYARKCGFGGALVGLSGGIDSAIVAALAAEALGPARVEGVLMPSRFTAERSNTDALELATNLGIRTRVIPIEPLHAAFLAALATHFEGKPADTTEENLQARIRGTLLMALSNKHGQLVLATGNKSEFGVGYCTLYGDMVGGLGVLGDCYKVWVRELARHLNEEREVIPQAILDRPPSAELRPDQEDEDDLPRYAILDRILDGFIERRRSRAELESEGLPREGVARVRAMLDRSEYKRRQAAPILRVSPRAFGPGRRLPMARAPL